jgi:hypothetical protein
MSRARLLAGLVLAALTAVGCSKECDTCSSDADCADGLICVSFSDGSRRCGSGVGATTCRVR